MKNPFASAPPARQVFDLRQAELTIWMRYAALLEEFNSLGATIGDETLDALLNEGDGGAVTVTTPAARLLECQAQLDALTAAEDTARNRRRDAIRLANAAEADVLHEQARAKRAEAEAHEKKTLKLLRELEKHEGCRYVAYDPQHMLRREVELGPRIDFTEKSQLSPLGALVQGVKIVPRTKFLRDEADALDSQAAHLRARQPKMATGITSTTREGMWDYLVNLDAMSIGPKDTDVVAWLQRSERPVLAQLAKLQGVAMNADDPLHPARGKEVRYDLIVRDGKVDPASRVYIWQPLSVKDPERTARNEQIQRENAEGRSAAVQSARSTDPRDMPVRVDS